MEINPDPLSDIIIDFLMSKSRETAELDFKYIVDISRKGDFPKIAKDIFAFSNYGGGHILIGFLEKETGSIEAVGLSDNFHIDQADLQEKFNSYSNEPIELGYLEFQRDIDGKDKKFAAINIPGSRKILKVVKAGTYKDEKGVTKTAFEAGDIFYRRGTQSIKASYEEMKYIENRASLEEKRNLLLSGEPDLINENIFSNLFPLINLPENLNIIKVYDPSTLELDSTISYFETSDTIYTFNDNIFQTITPRNIETSRTEKISNLLNNNQENLITAILNKEITTHCKKIGLFVDRGHTYFYPTHEVELKKTWQSRYRTPIRLVAQKMYFNKLKKAAFSTQMPITLHFAREVGRVLSELPDTVTPRDHYKFYM